MADTADIVADSPGYDEDFFAWTQAQAATLRRLAETGVNLPLDLLNLAEEIESLGKRDRRKIDSLMLRVVEHLTKLELSPASEPRAKWKGEIAHWRKTLSKILKESPSLRAMLPDSAKDASQDAAELIARQFVADGESSAAVFASFHSGYSADQITEDWWPENRA